MNLDRDAFLVALDGFSMQLRRGELESVATGLGNFDVSAEGNLLTLVEALRRMPVNERAPVWELAVRRYGRRKPIEQAAGEIGLDPIHARDLLDRFGELLSQVPPPERTSIA